MADISILSPTQQLVYSLYKDEVGNPIVLTPGQDILFQLIAQRQYPRVQTMNHTRQGKSMTVGLAVNTRTATFPEKWAIIAGTKDKAKIVMDYVIAHIFDNDWTASRFVPEKGESLDDIRRYRNKSRITFRVGKKKIPIGDSGTAFEVINLYGEVFIGSAKDALGFGAPNVVEDEAALIDDDDHSMVTRMLGDHPEDNFLIKIGNPFRRNHFLASYHDPKFKKVVFDCYRSLEEGKGMSQAMRDLGMKPRMTEELIEENRPYPFFGVMFECKFPSAAEVDESGWMYLLTDNDIKVAQSRPCEQSGTRKLGIDVARGGRNFNAWVMRAGNYAEVIKKTREMELEPVVEDTINIMHDLGIPPHDVYIDDTGVGYGLVQALKMRGFDCNAVNFGGEAEKEEIRTPNGEDKMVSGCLNARAEMYAGKDGLMSWVKQGGYLKPHADWIEGTRIRYKKNEAGKTKIEPKDDMRKRGVESPDVMDALALTFAKVKKVTYYGNISPTAVLSGNLVSPHGGVGWK